jgi:hypothetical protein
MENSPTSPVPDLRSECKGIDAQVERLLRIVRGRVADPAAVALLRLTIAPVLGPAFERHTAKWPVARIAREWRLFGSEIEEMFAPRTEGARKAA